MSTGEREAEYVARLEAMTARLEREAADARRSLAQTLERRAEAARSGELGKDWQEVQRRVDAGQTTVAAVFTGQDDTPAARRLVGLARTNLARAGEQLPDEVRDELTGAEADHARLGRASEPPRLVTDPEEDSQP